MVLVCPPDHPLANQDKVNLKQLNNEPFVAFSRDLIIRKEVDRLLRSRKTRIHIVMEFDNIETIKQAVEIGSGVSILPEPTVQKETQLGTLQAVPLAGSPLTRPIGILHHHRKIFTPTAVQFVELLKQADSDTD
jgi:DNA-binding transcriptional LysR family regulator